MKRLLLACSFAFLCSSAGLADAIPEVRTFVEEEITKLVASPIHDGLRDPSAPLTYDNYSLSLFRLRLKASVGFDAGVARVAL